MSEYNTELLQCFDLPQGIDAARVPSQLSNDVQVINPSPVTIESPNTRITRADSRLSLHKTVFDCWSHFQLSKSAISTIDREVLALN